MKEINELKAKAYDIIGNLEFLKQELDKTNAEIAKKIHEYNEAMKKVDNGEQPEPANQLYCRVSNFLRLYECQAKSPGGKNEKPERFY